MAGPVTLGGSAVFAFTMVFVMAFVPATDPVILLFPAAALGVVLGGLLSGRRRARLLREGEFIPATVTACRFGVGDNATYLPPSEYRQRRDAAPDWTGARAVLTLATGFLAVWTFLATAFLVFGIVFCVAMLVGALFVLPAAPRDRMQFALAIGGFLVLWILVAGFMARGGWRCLLAAWGRGGVPKQMPPVPCAFEFRLPSGARVEAKAPGRVGDGPGPEPPQSALYDPTRPTRARLLSGLGPEVRLNDSGSWETSAGLGSLLRPLLALALVAGPLVAWALL